MIISALQSAFRCRIAKYASHFIALRVKHFNYQECDTTYDKGDFASNKVHRLKNTELLFYRFSDPPNRHGGCRRIQASHVIQLAYSRNQ
jgi:hypothetical protein